MEKNFKLTKNLKTVEKLLTLNKKSFIILKNVEQEKYRIPLITER